MKKLSWQEARATDPNSCGDSRWQEGQGCRLRALTKKRPENNAARGTGETEGALLEEKRVHPKLRHSK
eukprot:bmy_12666T0